VDEHRAPWEPRGFYLFRRLLRAGVGLVLLSGFLLALFLYRRHVWCPSSYRAAVVIVLVTAGGVGVLGVVVASVGMIVTAPKDGKRGRTRSEDEPTEPRRRL
jgi:hypothetical protein